ncbi:MAG: hypothetical protein PHU97_01095 [Bacteroidales bacterium]|nr:hypothetical protein [Bacteroidales bacterium]MDD2322317.1 hypothetical protein [Bacteroidales bacterium]MDD3009897.1 hypothetical protein [Bacteroidales bacterium]MDD3961456.1 hypothetical protein [Bacteroidales bacterium]MDY0285171.1 hypothetical protein [Bacteroidales bacterium]
MAEKNSAVNLIHQLKYTFALKLLNRDAKKRIRKRVLINFSKAKKIGLLYVLDNEETYRDIVRFVNNLQDKGKIVKALGRFYGDLQPLYYIPRLSFDLLKSDTIGWLGQPKAEFADRFIQEEFDVLFYFSQDSHFALEYSYALSKSKLKVCNESAVLNPYTDLMIKVKSNNTLTRFLDTAIHYLSIINHSDE